MPDKVPFVDLARIHAPLRAELLAVLGRAVDTSAFALGKAVSDFERAFGEYCEAKHCVGVSSGTDALELALRAAGVGPGDEVVTVPNTFVATVEAVRLVGATPVFVDVEEGTQLIDVTKIEAATTDRTAAIVPVHLFGQPADVDPVLEIASRHELSVIEDACQAHGARYKERRVGGLDSFATCFSFYVTKNLGALGEGGAVTTNDRDVAERVRRMRDHGSSEKYRHVELGRNSRLHAIQAGFLSVKLPHLDEWNEQRRRAAARYAERLSGLDGVVLPETAPHAEHVFHLYVARLPDRDGARAFLEERGIATGIHYPVPCHLQQAYQDLGPGEGSFPVAERLAGEIISLPMFAGISDVEIDRVCDAVAEWAGGCAR